MTPSRPMPVDVVDQRGSGRTESLYCGLWFVEGVAECVVDPLDGGPFVVVPGLVIDARHADPVAAGDGTDPQLPLAGEAPQLGSQRLLCMAIGDLGDAVAV